MPGLNKKQSSVSILWAAFAAWVAFLLVRPYHGLVHDGVIYAAQSLFWAHPEYFRHDLFFVTGAQHDFSVFGRLAGGYLDFLGGLAELGKQSALLASVGWLLSFSYLICGLVVGVRRVYVLLALIATVPVYGGATGGDWLLHFAELHFTPRVWAESLCLLATGAALRRRFSLVVLALMAAAALHILVTIGAAGLILLLSMLRARSDRELKLWVGVGLIGALAVLVPALAGKMPFAMLFTRYDGLWWDVVSEVNERLVFPTRWGWASWSALLWSVMAQSIVLSVARGRLRAYILAVLALQAIAFAVAIVVGDIGRNPLILSLQLWRVQWLGQVAGTISLGYLIWFAVRRRRLWPATISIFIAQASLGSILSPLAVMVAAMAWALEMRSHLRAELAHRVAATFGLCAAVFSAHVVAQLYLTEQFGFAEPLKYTLRGVAAIGFGALLFALMRRPLVARVAIVVAAVAIYQFYWDHRTPETIAMEAKIGPTTAIGRNLPNDAAIVWVDGPLDGPWLILGRSSYVDVVHATNVLFNKTYAEEYVRRVMNVKELFEPTEGLSDEVLTRVCARDYALTHIVVPPSKVTHVIERFQLRLEHRRQGEHWIVPCSAYRAQVLSSGWAPKQ